jgi:hypothetical protein
MGAELDNEIMTESLALERARIYRRLFVTRCGLLAVGLVLAAAAFRRLAMFEVWFSVALCLVAPVWACVAERRCYRQLARRLRQVA